MYICLYTLYTQHKVKLHMDGARIFNAATSRCKCVYMYVCIYVYVNTCTYTQHKVKLHMDGARGGGLGSRPQKMYGERLGDGVEYHLMKPTPRR